MSQEEIKYSIVGAGFVPGLPAIITRAEATALGKEVLEVLDAAIASDTYAEYIAPPEPIPAEEPPAEQPAAPKSAKKKE